VLLKRLPKHNVAVEVRLLRHAAGAHPGRG
jgi:hypothetical protein